MNIQEAKDQIKKAIQIYLAKDEFGNYRIPVKRQRPVFLLGAPGIGKTAIMEQIAAELGLALVSYSMTHHTRQSALGLPFISHKTYGETTFDVSEYTMSEIIASVYETMEATGKKEGILFLDEINCVSETLSPSMLQFLQYKTFGRHKVPEGWIVATAGNPPQFNRSVREFDVVTMDRLKILEVEAEYDAWRSYALNKGIHGAILSYLDIRKNDFYTIENTVDGKAYVTARGWEDLSEAMYLYEENGFSIDEAFLGQYLRHKRICREFASYCELYEKYKKDYRIHEILSGRADADVQKRAKNAAFDERLSLIGLLLDALFLDMRKNVTTEDALRRLLLILRSIKEEAETKKEGLAALLAAHWEALQAELEEMLLSGAPREEEKKELQFVISTLQQYAALLQREGGDFALLKAGFEEAVSSMQRERKEIGEKLSHLFRFVEKQFGENNEMLVLVTDLTVNEYSAKFIARTGCREYEKYNKKFQLYERKRELLEAVERLDKSAFPAI